MAAQPKLGLVLGSGGLRGLAHAGVLSVFEENNIKIDLVAGCSIGSLIGALICTGYASDNIMQIARTLKPNNWFEFGVTKKGFIGAEKIHEIVSLLTREQKLEDLKIPLGIVATELATGKEKVFLRGNLADAVCASLAVPGIFVPYVLANKQFADGALVNPTPVDLAKKMGADCIVAVDLAAVSTIDEVTNIFDVVLRSLDIMEKGLFSYRRLEQDCDILIRPELSSYRITDFSKMDECYTEGRRAALAVLPELEAKIADYSSK